MSTSQKLVQKRRFSEENRIADNVFLVKGGNSAQPVYFYSSNTRVINGKVFFTRKKALVHAIVCLQSERGSVRILLSGVEIVDTEGQHLRVVTCLSFPNMCMQTQSWAPALTLLRPHMAFALQPHKSPMVWPENFSQSWATLLWQMQTEIWQIKDVTVLNCLFYSTKTLPR